MLAYLFWHRPRAGRRRRATTSSALRAFHRSLAHQPPGGLRGVVRAFASPSCPGCGAGREAAPGGRLRGLVPARGLRRARRAERGRRGARAPHRPRPRRAPLRRRRRRALRAARGRAARRWREARVGVWVARGARDRPSPAARRAARRRHGRRAARASGGASSCSGPAPEFCLLAREAAAGGLAGAPAGGLERAVRSPARRSRGLEQAAAGCPWRGRRGSLHSPASSRLALGWSSPPGSDDAELAARLGTLRAPSTPRGSKERGARMTLDPSSNWRSPRSSSRPTAASAAGPRRSAREALARLAADGAAVMGTSHRQKPVKALVGRDPRRPRRAVLAARRLRGRARQRRRDRLLGRRRLRPDRASARCT